MSDETDNGTMEDRCHKESGGARAATAVRTCDGCARLRAEVSRAVTQLARDQRDIDNCRAVINALLLLASPHHVEMGQLPDGTPLALASRRALGLAL